MNFVQAVMCLKDNKCEFIWRLGWKDKAEANRIKYNSFDDCLEFGINNKIYYAKDTNDICSNDWVAINYTFPAKLRVHKYMVSKNSSFIWDSPEELMKANPHFTGSPILMEGYIDVEQYTVEDDFNLVYYCKTRDDIIFELASLLDNVLKHQPISGTLLKNIKETLEKVSNGVY